MNGEREIVNNNQMTLTTQQEEIFEEASKILSINLVEAGNDTIEYGNSSRKVAAMERLLKNNDQIK